MAKVAIFTEEMYEDIEFWYPFYRLQEAGHSVVVIGSGTQDSYTGKHGCKNQVDSEIKNADPETFDAVVIPGGYAPDKMRLHPEFMNFVRKTYDAGKLVASLCHGPWILASAGIIRGKKLTSWPSLKDDLMNAGAMWQDQAVVIDGNIITSRKPDDLPAFMTEVVKALENQVQSEAERRKVAPVQR